MSKMLAKLLRAGLPLNDESLALLRKQEINEFKKHRILHLKQLISNTDYQVIKCMEYQVANMDMPYDIVKLHDERQSFRDEITRLEAELEVDNE